MDRKLLYALGAGVVIMGFTAWLCFTPPAAKDAEGDFKFMHCPKCGFESRFHVRKFAKGCPRCGEDQTLVGTRLSLAETGGFRSPYARMIPPLLIEGNILLVVLLYLGRPASRRRTDDEDVYYIRCHKCKRRIRFRASQAGDSAACPVCRAMLAFPAIDSETESPRRWDLVRWWKGLRASR